MDKTEVSMCHGINNCGTRPYIFEPSLKNAAAILRRVGCHDAETTIQDGGNNAC